MRKNEDNSLYTLSEPSIFFHKGDKATLPPGLQASHSYTLSYGFSDAPSSDGSEKEITLCSPI